jgi:hypothetical protein
MELLEPRRLARPSVGPHRRIAGGRDGLITRRRIATADNRGL